MTASSPAPQHIVRLNRIATYFGRMSTNLAALGYTERGALYRQMADQIENDVASMGGVGANKTSSAAMNKGGGWRPWLHAVLNVSEHAFGSDWTPRILYTLMLWVVTGGLIRALDGKLTTIAGQSLLGFMAGALSPALLLFIIVAQAMTFFLLGLFGLMYSQPMNRVSKEALIDGVRQYYTFGASACGLTLWYGHWKISLVFLMLGVVSPWAVLVANGSREQG